MGKAGFSAGEATQLSFAFQPNTSVPYLAFQDGSNANKAMVMAFSGSDWRPVGAAASTGTADYLSLAFEPTSSVPYLAYQDGDQLADPNHDFSGKLTVRRFTGKVWIAVGSPGFSAGMLAHISLGFQPNSSVAHVAYSDAATWPQGKATVMAFSGTSWVYVGSQGFTAFYTAFNSLAFHPTTSAPYVGFADDGYQGAATVMTFDGLQWNPVGTPGFSVAGYHVRYTHLAFKPSTSELYISYQNWDATIKATVMRFDGVAGSWVPVGPLGFTPNTAGWPMLAFNPTTSVPTVAFEDQGDPGWNKATVMAFDEGTNSWGFVGARDFSAFYTDYTCLAFAPNSSLPYVAYRVISTLQLHKPSTATTASHLHESLPLQPITCMLSATISSIML